MVSNVAINPKTYNLSQYTSFPACQRLSNMFSNATAQPELASNNNRIWVAKRG